MAVRRNEGIAAQFEEYSELLELTEEAGAGKGANPFRAKKYQLWGKKLKALRAAVTSAADMVRDLD